MRTITKAPHLYLNDRGPAVTDLQNLLNQSDGLSSGVNSGNHVWSSTAFLNPDGIFGGKTQAKVMEFQRRFGLQVDGIVGPETNTQLFSPLADFVDNAQRIATNWTFLARAAVANMLSFVNARRADGSDGPGVPAAHKDALRVHFKIDLPDSGSGEGLEDLANKLQSMFQVYDDALAVLLGASIRTGNAFHFVGPELNTALHKKPVNVSAFTHSTFPTKLGPIVIMCFPATFNVSNPDGDSFRTTSQQASTVLHECCHYVRPIGSTVRIVDVAYGLPALAGQPGRNGTHNYLELTADEAQRNAESFNLFAEHVTFGRDTRFGRVKDDLVAFTCGGAEFCN